MRGIATCASAPVLQGQLSTATPIASGCGESMQQVAFAGGMAILLRVTDERVAHDARSTDDVDMSLLT